MPIIYPHYTPIISPYIPVYPRIPKVRHVLKPPVQTQPFHGDIMGISRRYPTSISGLPLDTPNHHRFGTWGCELSTCLWLPSFDDHFWYRSLVPILISDYWWQLMMASQTWTIVYCTLRFFEVAWVNPFTPQNTTFALVFWWICSRSQGRGFSEKISCCIITSH